MNIAEILRKCPKGTKLYSAIYGELSLVNAQPGSIYPICCRVVRSGNEVDFTEDGKNCSTDAEPTLFPSKDQRDWSKFVATGQATDQKQEIEFEPFDKVLVRDNDYGVWLCDLFRRVDEDNNYDCVGSFWEQCIPYEGNEHLLGTTKKPNNNETN